MSFIEVMISDLCNLSLENGFSTSLTQTLAQYNSGTNTTIVGLMKGTVFAVGASLLTLFMLLELVAMINRANGSETGLNSIKLPAHILIKFGVFAIVFCHIPALLNGIEATAASIGSGIIADYNFGVGIDETQIASLASAIDSLGFFNKIFTYIVIFVCWLFVHFVEGILSITVVFRAFELWLMLLLSPIPLATLASQDFRQTAINFLKSFTAVCLQGTAIVACFLIYQALMGSFVTTYDSSMDTSTFVNSFLLQNIIYTAVLAVSVFSSGRIVKQIMGAM
ncbi:MAG: type IV secretion system protein [Firmicutes bacterium]|nr:type IV secretion system protein [Bacillota bacterium]